MSASLNRFIEFAAGFLALGGCISGKPSPYKLLRPTQRERSRAVGGIHMEREELLLIVEHENFHRENPPLVNTEGGGSAGSLVGNYHLIGFCAPRIRRTQTLEVLGNLLSHDVSGAGYLDLADHSPGAGSGEFATDVKLRAEVCDGDKKHCLRTHPTAVEGWSRAVHLRSPGEYVITEVAELNGYTLYLPHWRDEVCRLLDLQLYHFIRNKPTKAKFDKAVVVEDVIAEYDPQIVRWLESAKTRLANNYFKKKKKTKRRADFKLPGSRAMRGGLLGQGESRHDGCAWFMREICDAKFGSLRRPLPSRLGL